MQSNKIIFPVFFLLLFLQRAAGQEFSSQPTGRGEYSLVAYVSGGFGYYPSEASGLAYINPRVRKWNPVTTARVMWHPDHLVKVGLETGYMTFMSYDLTDSTGRKGKVALNAVPLLVEWSMSLTKHFNVFAGSGVYFLNTNLDYGEKTSSKKLSVGWMAAVSYILPVSKNMGIGTEVKWLDAAESRDGSISAQVQLVWRFLKW